MSASSKMIVRLLLMLACIASTRALAADSPTLAAIRARGSVVCGMQADNAPFSLPDSQGVWRGMDVDSCRALAAATLGDPKPDHGAPDHWTDPLPRAAERGDRRAVR